MTVLLSPLTLCFFGRPGFFSLFRQPASLSSAYVCLFPLLSFFALAAHCALSFSPLPVADSVLLAVECSDYLSYLGVELQHDDLLRRSLALPALTLSGSTVCILQEGAHSGLAGNLKGTRASSVECAKISLATPVEMHNIIQGGGVE